MENFTSNHFDITKLPKIIPPNSGPYKWVFKGEHPGPTATIFGGSHGNEHAGLYVIEHILTGIKHKKIGVVGGSLQLAVGNPLACMQNERFVEIDMNRCFGKNPPLHLSDAQRAGELKPMLDETDVLIDIHCTMKPSEPFLAVPSMALGCEQFLCSLGIPTIITGPGLLPPNGDCIYADSYVAAQKKLGVTMEAGCKDDPLLVPHVIACIKNALKSLGIIEEASQKFTIFEAHQNVIATPGFTFVKEFKNWDELKAGETYAIDASGFEFKAPCDSYIIFAKPPHLIVPGQEACILIKK